MTREEAKEILQGSRITSFRPNGTARVKEALDMAIEALSEETPTIQEKHQPSEETPTVFIDGIGHFPKLTETSQNLTEPNNTCEGDLISRADAIEAVCGKCSAETRAECALSGYFCCDRRELEALPSANRPNGEWIDKGWKGDWQFETDGRGNCWHEYECSACGFRNIGSNSNFCPNCGADMRGDNNG